MIIISKRYNDVRYILLASPQWPVFKVTGQWDYNLNVFIPEPSQVFTQRQLQAIADKVKKLI